MALLFLCGSGYLHASTVELQEIPLSLYNKPVTGYRLTLDRSQRFVEQQILKHVAEFDAKKPFQYERTIIYENIRYSPITSGQQISLHYLLRGYENHYTEITLVAMYDLRRSINTSDFPDLAIKLQIDLAKLVRKTSGDLMKFGDIVFDDNKIKELQAKLAIESDPVPSDPQASRTKVVIPDKGFEDTYASGGNSDSLIAALKRRVTELENREKEWLRQEDNLRDQQKTVNDKQADLQSKIAENNDLRDSVLALNKRMKSLLGHYYHSDDISVSNETAEYIAGLERENKRQEHLIRSLERSNDSLSGLLRAHAQQMEGISKGRQGMADEIAALRASQSELQARVAKLNEELASRPVNESSGQQADSLLIQLKSAQRKSATQEEELQAVKTESERLEKENRGLMTQVEGLQGRIRDLESEMRRLESQGSAKSDPAETLALQDSVSALRKREADLQRKLSQSRQQAQAANDLNIENAGLRDSLTRLNRRMAEMDLRATSDPGNTALQDSVSALRKREADLQRKLSQSRQQALATNDLNIENAGLRDSLTRLNRRMAEMNARATSDPGNSALQDSVSALRKREADLQRKLSQSRQQALAANDLNVENAGLRDSLTRLNRRISEMGTRLKATASNKVLEDSLAAVSRREQRLLVRIKELNSAKMAGDPSLTKENEVLRDSLAAVRGRMNDLKTKLADAEKRAEANSKPAVLEPSPETKALRDSLNLMKSRMSFIQGKLSTAEAQAKQVEAQSLTLKQKDAELRGLKEKLSNSQTQLSGSQVERKRLEQSLYAAQASLKSAQDAFSASKAEQDRLNKEKSALQVRLTEAERSSGLDATSKKAMMDSITVLHKEMGELEGQIGVREKSIRTEIQRRDSLQKLLNQQVNVENDLKRQLALMQTKVDSLSRLTMPVQDQQKFIRDQWAKLTEWEKQLDARDKSTANQEKLIAQKQTSLDTREKDVQRREAAIVGLEDRERQVSLREQQVNTREQLSGADINPADVKVGVSDEMGNVPVFSVQTMLNFRAAQKQVVSYMLSRDILLSEQIPDLLFKNVYISELSQGQMELRVRVDSRSGGSLIHFSFKLADGTHLGGAQNVKMNESVKQFIVRALRYKV